MTKKFTGLFSVTAVFVSCFVLIVTMIFPSASYIHFATEQSVITGKYSDQVSGVVKSSSTERGEGAYAASSEDSYAAFPETAESLAEIRLPEASMGHRAFSPEGQISIPLNSPAPVQPEEITVTYPGGIALTETELQMLQYVVQAEANGKSLEHKIAVTEVVMNRVHSPRFPETVGGVLTSHGQFCSMGGFYSRGDFVPDETTRRAVELVLAGEAVDYSQGALYFCNLSAATESSWFETKLSFLFELEGHRFYC